MAEGGCVLNGVLGPLNQFVVMLLFGWRVFFPGLYAIGVQAKAPTKVSVSLL